MNEQPPLSSEQIRQLVQFVLEDHGDTLNLYDFSELFLLMMEDVPFDDKGPVSEVELVHLAYGVYEGLTNS